MKPEQARDEIARRTVVNRQLVTLAKAFLLSSDRPCQFEPDVLMAEFAKLQGFEKTQEMVLHPSLDLETNLNRVAGFVSCSIAVIQALWELIGAGHYMAYGNVTSIVPHQSWTDVVPGSGGQRAGWSFPEFTHVVPNRAMRSAYWRSQAREDITDPDIFVLEAGVEGADPEVVEALRDAVGCLQAELHRPAVTLLGKAMEGAWIELGIALVGTLPNDATDYGDSFVEEMKGEGWSIARKIREVRTLYARRDLLGAIIKASGIRPRELDSAVVWSDVVREARNAIHFGGRPSTDNSYEKTVVLFLEGAKVLGMMYGIKRVASERA